MGNGIAIIVRILFLTSMIAEILIASSTATLHLTLNFMFVNLHTKGMQLIIHSSFE